MSVRDVLENLRNALDGAGVSYMVTGSFVSSVHGVPRATQDIDVVDAAGIIEIQGTNLDVEYVQRWAAALDIEDQLRAAREKANW